MVFHLQGFGWWCHRLLLIALCSGALAVAGCGGKKKPVSTPAPPGEARAEPQPAGPRAPASRDRPSPQEPTPSIRVLLQEGFSRARIEGSQYGASVEVRVSGTAIELLEVRGEDVHPLGRGTGFRLEPAAGNPIVFNGASYRGSLEAFINPLLTPVVVNEVDLEEYLQGVVPNELSFRRFRQPEAVKAQVVAARTFGVSHRGGYARRGFDVFTDQRSQVYGGLKSEEEPANELISHTRGLVAVYEGQPIAALYSSTCGGKTAEFEAVFPGPPIPYLRGGVECPDRSSNFHSWEERIPIPRIQSSLDRLAGVGRLKKLTPLSKSPSGRVVEMRFEGTTGKKVLQGNDLRMALGLRSNLIEALEPIHNRSGEIVEIRVRGRGWGHGVGMCQMGAVELARKGLSFEQILKRYYRGIDLVHYY